MDWENRQDVGKALLGLYQLQTETEKSLQHTIVRNAVGFNALDAPFCTSVARWVLDGRPFTDGQYKAIKNVIRKYERQISLMDLDSIHFPEPVSVKKKGKSKRGIGLTGDGLLIYKPEEDKLIFYPNIYPTKHVKKVWNCQGGKTAEGQWFWKGKFYPEIPEKIKGLFPEVALDPSVVTAVNGHGKKKILPAEILNHDKAFQFQKESVQFLINSSRSMLALAPGLGKTMASILAANALELDRILVICPTTLMRNWEREIKMWGKEDEEIQIWHQITPSYQPKWVVTNYETVTRRICEKDEKRSGKKWHQKRWKIKDNFEHRFDLVIIDESVMIKNRKAQRTQAMKELAKMSGRIWMLSGAPMTRNYSDMWSQFNILDRRRFSSFWRFAEEYTYVNHSDWGTTIDGNRPYAHEQIQKAYKDIYFARSQDDVLDLPPWIFDNVHVEMTSAQNKVYVDMEKDFVAELPSGDKVLTTNILAQMTRLVQFASNPGLLNGGTVADPVNAAKWKAVKEMVEYEELPAIIWTNFIKTADSMKDILQKQGHVVEVLTGRTPAHKRQDIVDRFQDGKVDILIAHPGVGKFGLTLTKARTAIYMERSYNHDDYFQSLHRVRRIGTESSPHVIHVIAEKKGGGRTIDHVIDRVLGRRKEDVMKITSQLIREELSD